MKFIKKSLSPLLSLCLLMTTAPGASAYQGEQPGSQSPVESGKKTQAQLQQLIAPIALYADGLVAQILAAATYPDQIVEADRWMQAHPDLKGEELGKQVDQQAWDPSVKALTEFPSVLANMDKNLSWTSSLGDAYINQQKDLMKAVQEMRKRAQKAGNLKTTSQENVTKQGQTIVVAPANPQVVYVPEYDPWLVYGAPLVAWPGWYWYPGLFFTEPGIAFGVGFGLGFFGGFGWGWHNWGFDWHHSSIIYNHNRYISHSRTFTNRNYYANRSRGDSNHAGGSHAGNAFHSAGAHGSSAHEAGLSASQHESAGHSQSGMRSSAFSGFNHGGATRGFSAAGRSSFGGGFHGGGGRR